MKAVNMCRQLRDRSSHHKHHRTAFLISGVAQASGLPIWLGEHESTQF